MIRLDSLVVISSNLRLYLYLDSRAHLEPLLFMYFGSDIDCTLCYCVICTLAIYMRKLYIFVFGSLDSRGCI
jgi:hypothetical protein